MKFMVGPAKNTWICVLTLFKHKDFVQNYSCFTSYFFFICGIVEVDKTIQNIKQCRYSLMLKMKTNIENRYSTEEYSK